MEFYNRLKREQAEREQRELEEKRARQELTLVFSDIRAAYVPGVKDNGRSDPYIRFTLMEVDEEETSRTLFIAGSRFPQWGETCTLVLPAGSNAVKRREPLLAVTVLDRVEGKEPDTVLGNTQFLALGGDTSGNPTVVEKLDLTGAGGHTNFAIDFSFRLSEEVPPPATLKVSDVSARNMPIGPDGRLKGKTPGDPFLRFMVLDVGDLHIFADVPAKPKEKKPSWEGLDLLLDLPKGSARPARVAVYLWDNGFNNRDDEPLGSGIAQLSESSGVAEVTITSRIKKLAAGKALTVSFKYEQTEL